MDAIVTAALIGTAQRQNIDTTTGTVVDKLAEKLASGEVERSLLLSAGAWAIYRQAGRVADFLPAAPPPSAEETLPACSPEIAALIESLLKGEQQQLLPEALECMRKAGLRLPYEMLPTAMAVQETELRAGLFHVIGERGRWLSQFNPAWSWVGNYLYGAEDDQLAHAETNWQEGTLGQRQAVLRLLRKNDPTKAREWLSAVWKQEKADARTDLLGTLEVGLSAEDEEFLENALDDRSTGVRIMATSLLARLPTSSFVRRMRERADTMLKYKAKSLNVTLPTALEKDWLRDGIAAKPSHGAGERSWWFTQVVSQVTPTHWEERFGVSRDTIIAAAYADDDWSDSLITSWSSAALLHNCGEWCMALWDWWCKKQRGTPELGVRTSLLTRMSQREAEQRVASIFNNARHPARKNWEEALIALPKPWSHMFGEVYLQELRAYMMTLDFKKDYSPYYDPWYQSISVAMMALPPSCFASALVPFTIPTTTEQKATWQTEYWRTELKKFTEALHIRQRFIKEMT
jgi:hypothetical protein